jgi:hypothetical protein
VMYPLRDTKFPTLLDLMSEKEECGAVADRLVKKGFMMTGSEGGGGGGLRENKRLNARPIDT